MGCMCVVISGGVNAVLVPAWSKVSWARELEKMPWEGQR